ncbi:FeoB-associated Cys-rich membrane protein [Ruminococcaceae bacterium OttesenSCG-928-N02]|nr:FeoB-associated Cys-rich membrane protein [Ruminococcaceae bacterium OttesenSCG-928-N02]
MENMIIMAILFVIIGGVTTYLVRAKKRGEVCIGCPHAKQCAGGACKGAADAAVQVHK